MSFNRKMDKQIWNNGVYTAEYYSDIKENDIMKFVDKWMEIEKQHLFFFNIFLRIFKSTNFNFTEFLQIHL